MSPEPNRSSAPSESARMARSLRRRQSPPSGSSSPTKWIVVVILLSGCSKKAEDKRPKGKLCFAANAPELFTGEPFDSNKDKPVAIKYRTKTLLPGEQHAFEDAREGEPVAVMLGDKLLESWKVNFKRLGNDLCYYYRGKDPAKPERNPNWILDANTADDRCTCFEPAAPAGSGSGSAK